MTHTSPDSWRANSKDMRMDVNTERSGKSGGTKTLTTENRIAGVLSRGRASNSLMLKQHMHFLLITLKLTAKCQFENRRIKITSNSDSNLRSTFSKRKTFGLH